MARQESTGPLPPRLHRPTLRTLAPGDPSVLDGDEDLDDMEFRDLRVDEITWTGRRRLGASRLSGLVAQEWSAPGASVVGSVIDGIEVVALSAPESGWWNVEVTQSRIGSAELYDSNWRSVSFTRCKLGYLNLRGAKLADVAFTDCIIEDLDLMRATATRVAFDGCRIDRLELVNAQLTDVDLRGARLADVGNLEGLKGASITLEQLLDLAPAMAARLGIRID
jgi:uncharacterized protein YjbI with pentapeptide repeats